MPDAALPVAPLYSVTATALPGDVTTCTITFGAYSDVVGVAPASFTGRLYPVDPHDGRRVRLLNTTTGHVLLPSDIPITITAGVGSVGPIPHTDNASLAPAGFAYRVEWNVPSSRPSPGNKTFILPTSVGDTVDFDPLIAPDPIAGGLAFPGVFSVNGQTGAAVLDATDVGAQPAGSYVEATGLDAIVAALLDDPTSATYARVVALIADRTGFGAGA